jgi:hypothetical protein
MNNRNVIQSIDARLRQATSKMSSAFNRLPDMWKRLVVITCGLVAAAICVAIIAQAVLEKSTMVLP